MGILSLCILLVFFSWSYQSKVQKQKLVSKYDLIKELLWYIFIIVFLVGLFSDKYFVFMRLRQYYGCRRYFVLYLQKAGQKIRSVIGSGLNYHRQEKRKDQCDNQNVERAGGTGKAASPAALMIKQAKM